jgi:4,5-dihydroxyphthalate decarboxylase
MSQSQKRRLKAVLGDYAHTAAIKSGALCSNAIDFEFVEYTPVWDGFDEMVRHQAFDVCEMAAVTYLLCMAHNKPMALLPAAMFGRFQHPFAFYMADKGVLTPKDLEGKRVGVRSVTTTTGTWVRGHLAFDYGVDLDKVHWVTFEEPHVAECEDRSERAPPRRKIIEMLLAGDLDAVVGERAPDDPRIRTIFPDPQAEAARWFGTHALVPINHLVVVRQELLETEPETVREVWRLLQRGKAASSTASPDPIPFGIEANRRSLELLSHYAHRMKLIPRAYTADDMFAPFRSIVD